MNFKFCCVWENTNHFFNINNILGIPVNGDDICLTAGLKMIDIERLGKDFLNAQWLRAIGGIGYCFVNDGTTDFGSQILLHIGGGSYLADSSLYSDIYNTTRERNGIHAFTASAAFNTFLFYKNLYFDLNISYKRYFWSTNLAIVSAQLRSECLSFYDNHDKYPNGKIKKLHWEVNAYLLAGYELMSMKEIEYPAFNLGLGINFQLPYYF